MSAHEKFFILEHSFENAESLHQDEIRVGDLTEHYGIQWRIGIHRLYSQFIVYLIAQYPETNQEIIFDLVCEYSLVSKTGARWCTFDLHTSTQTTFTSWSNIFLNWQSVQDFLIVDGTIRMMAEVRIKGIDGFYKPNLRSFDITTREFSDIVLLVEDEEFYVLKQYLALHSPLFRAMLLGGFSEAQQSRVVLQNIDACDFQKYLELLYGDWSIDEMNVEALLEISDKFDTTIVTRKCQQFLVNTSRKAVATKRRLAEKFDLEELKAQCDQQEEGNQEHQEEA